MQDERRRTSTERGYGWRWRCYSARRLKEHPLCVACEEEGIVGLASETDHRIPVTGPDDPLFWEPTNHQSLCGMHHRRKTATEDGGFGRKPLPRAGRP